MTTDLRPRLPIGISDFRYLREPGVIYVDKTDFVVQVLASQAAVVLLPRPRRFGKTVNLSTLRYFVERSKEDRSALFTGLAVATSATARPHFQRYPVISLTFKDIKAGTFDAAFAAIRSVLRRAHQEHAYLLDEGALRPEEAARFQQILSEQGPTNLYADALLDLSGHLARHHGERAVILIDEYDTPVHAAATAEDERRLLDFFRSAPDAALKAPDEALGPRTTGPLAAPPLLRNGAGAAPRPLDGPDSLVTSGHVRRGLRGPGVHSCALPANLRGDRHVHHQGFLRQEGRPPR